MPYTRKLTDITKHIKKARRSGSSDYAIARELQVDQAEIKRLLSGKYPGEKVAARLGIPVKCHACHRRIPETKVRQAPREKADHEIWWRSLTKEQRENFIKQWHQQAGAY